jgi:4'-phosphopantetheinyl transferase
MSQLPQESQIFVERLQASPWIDSPDLSLQSLDLWKISIPAYLHKVDPLAALLSPDEKNRASRYHQQKDKNRFVIGRGMLRQILSYYTDCPPDGIQFFKGINNKPYIHHPFLVDFNLSYSHDYILVGIASQPIGVDIEYINPQFDYGLLLEACFMDREINVIVNSPFPRQEFFLFWTRKEALLKATALGLGDYLTDFSCLEGFQPFPKTLNAEGDWRVGSFLLEKTYWISTAKKSSGRHRYINAIEFFK